MTILPDTNIILRYLIHDNETQFKTADQFFEKVRLGTARALILEGVIVECVYVLTKFYKIPRNEAAEKLESILRYKGIVNKDKEELINSLEIFVQKNIDIVDSIISVKSKSQGYALFSFDEKLMKLKKI
jgi:predicted nucleic-acid-binding protein